MARDPSRRRRSTWATVLASIFGVLVVLAAVAVILAFTWFDVSLSDGVGDRSYAPASGNDVRHSYELGVGNLELDLSSISPAQDVTVEARVGIGKLRVTVPHGASVALDARVKAGAIDALGQHESGHNARIRDTGAGKIHLKARVGAGAIDVVQAG